MSSKPNTKISPLSPVKTIIYSFILLTILLIGVNSYHSNHVEDLKTFSNTIYKHPLVVSSASLKAKSDVLKIQRDMLQFSLKYFYHEKIVSDNNTKLQDLQTNIGMSVDEINKELGIIQKNILGKEGKALSLKAQKQFDEWIKKHKIFYQLIETRDSVKVREYSKSFQNKQANALILSFDALHNYARAKADEFSRQTESEFNKAHTADLISVGLITLIFIIIGIYTVIKVNSYLQREEELMLKINEQRLQYEYAISGTQDGLWDWNLLDNTIFFSSNWKKMLGYKNNELENKLDTWKDLLHPEDLNMAEAKISEVIQNSDLDYESIHRLRHKDGHWVWILDRGQVIFNEEGQAIRMTGFHTDISTQKEQEIALKELGELVDNVVDTIEGLIFVKDVNYKYILCNEAFCKFVGKDKEEIVGSDDFSLFKKEIAEDFRVNDTSMFANDIATSNYEWVSYPDGSKKYLLTTKSPLKNSSNETIALVGYSTDITVHKNLEDQLVYQQALLKQAQKISRLGYWTLNAKDESLVWSDEVYALFGYDKRIGYAGLEMFKNSVHPDDRDRVLGEYDESVRNKTDYECRHRVVLPNKEIEYVLEKANHEYDANGEFIRSIGTVQDITKETLSDLEIKKRDAQQLELGYIIEHTHSEVYLVDANSMKFVFVNQAVLNNLGYSMEEIMQIFPLDINKNFVDKHYKNIISSLAGTIKQQVRFETEHTRKDGTSYPVQMNIQKTTYNNKSVYLAVAIDITNELKAQKEIRKQEEIMIAQSRHAAMGEMIGMIAHQWRQPITTIAMGANNMLADIALEINEPENVEDMANMIVEQTQYLSQTIEDFRNFFKPDKEKSSVRLFDVVENTLSILADSMKAHAIGIKIDIEPDACTNTYERELIQVYINILKNAKEALVDTGVQDPFIKISVYSQENKVITRICDNAGGIKEEIRDKIFDPYFTTKDEITGTGLGLYMSRTIVEKHLLGKLSVNCNDKGSCFIIILDKESCDEK